MRHFVLSAAGGFCLAIGTSSPASADPLKFTCPPSTGRGEGFAVVVDMDGHRAKAHILSFPDDKVPFSPATVTPDSVSWKVYEPREQLTNIYTLDRTTGTFTQGQTGAGGETVYSFVCKAATRLF
jgi:hypothetical protein